MIFDSKLSKTLEILLVEDSPDDMELISNLFSFTDLSYRLQIAKDGIEAIAYLNQLDDNPNDSSYPDLILLDLNLPKKDGKETLAEIKADSRFSQIPIIILTSSDCQQDIVQCYQMDANCYLTKPSNIEDFSRLIKMIEDFWFNTVILPPH